MAAPRVWSCGNFREGEMTPNEFQQLRAAYARHAIPELIELLASEELRVRFFAEMALRDATST